MSDTELASFFKEHLVVYKAVNNIIERFTTLEHVNDQSLLDMLLIIFNVFSERFITASKIYKEAVVFVFKSQLLGSDKVSVTLDPNNWNFYIKLINNLTYLLVYLFTLSAAERNRGAISKNIHALFIEFFLCHASEFFSMIEWILIISNNKLVGIKFSIFKSPHSFKFSLGFDFSNLLSPLSLLILFFNDLQSCQNLLSFVFCEFS